MKPDEQERSDPDITLALLLWGLYITTLLFIPEKYRVVWGYGVLAAGFISLIVATTLVKTVKETKKTLVKLTKSK